MADKVINTRLVLRNADLSAWEKSTVQLLKGEVALAQLSGDQAGQYKVRIGTGDKTWNELSDQGQLIIPATNVEGLTEAIAALSTSYYETDDIAKLSDEYVNGDIAVEKKDIADGKQEYCAYRYDKTSGEWKALDGNYNAENVYLKDNMTITYPFGKYTIPTSGSKELTCAGMNIKQFLNDAFSEEDKPNPKAPTASYSGPSNFTEKEVGEFATGVPALTFKFTADGYFDKYNEGLKGGNKVTLSSVSLTRTALKGEDFDGNVFNLTAINDSFTGTGDTLLNVNDTRSIAAEGATELSVRYTDSDINLVSYTGTAKYLEGTTVPKSNIGNYCNDKKVPAGTFTWAGATVKIPHGYRNFWIGSTADATSEINETFVKANLAKVKADGEKKYEIGAGTTSKTPGYTHLTLAENAKRIILVLPASGTYARTLSQVLLQSASNTPITDSYKSKGQIDVGGAIAGQNTIKYNVYVYQPDAIGADEVHDISIG